jgi:hypothetical protein
MNGYWSSTKSDVDPDDTWIHFLLPAGGLNGQLQYIVDPNSRVSAWAVRDGDVAAVPAAAWLFGSTLGLLGWMRRKSIVPRQR